MQEEIIKKLLKMTKRAAKQKEVPVASLIVYKNKILSKSYNKREKKHDPTAHAEIICVRKATKKLRTKYLTECEMYTTLIPCEMCMAVLKECRIKKVHYILDNPKKIDRPLKLKKIEIIQSNKFKEILRDFFINKR